MINRRGPKQTQSKIDHVTEFMTCILKYQIQHPSDQQITPTKPLDELLRKGAVEWISFFLHWEKIGEISKKLRSKSSL